MQKRFVYIYLRNPLSNEQIADIDRWLHQYCHEVQGQNGRWQFKMDGEQSQEPIEMDIREALPEHPDQSVLQQLNDCLGYVPQQKLELHADEDTQEKQQLVSTLAQCLATRFEGIVHYEVPKV